MRTEHYALIAIGNLLAVAIMLPINVPLAFACTLAGGAALSLTIMSYKDRLL